MVTTLSRSRASKQTVSDAKSEAGGSATPMPVRLRRQPALMAGGVVAICLGALLAAWAWTATTHTTSVLAARVTIHAGQVITAADLEQVQLGDAAALDPLPASAFGSVVGRRASLDIAAGSLVTATATTTAAFPPAGQSVVGVSLTAAQVPAVGLSPGVDVRVVVTPGQNGAAPSGAPLSTPAQVVDTHTDQTNGNTIVDVLVPYADAGVLAAQAATGNVALVLDSNTAGNQGGS